MKHIKLFESFDRYDFIRYLPSDCNLKELYNDMKFELMNEDDIKQIQNESGLNLSIFGIGDFNYLTYEVKVNAGKYYLDRVSIVINYLGDYCYSLTSFDVNDSSISYIEIFDGIDDIITHLKKIN